MKTFMLILLALGYSLVASSQILNPVKWSYHARRVAGGIVDLHLKATIDPGWHVYAQQAGKGPVPTSFSFRSGHGVALIGKTLEHGALKASYDPNFKSILRYYEHSVDFVQRVRLSPSIQAVSGSLEFMVCNNQECLPPKDLDFKIAVP